MTYRPTFQYERTFQETGCQYIAGVDEAGRGPLAGPVVAAAVILRPAETLPNLQDSKLLSPRERDTLLWLITQKALAIGVGIVDHTTIDEINIRQATLLAMKKALLNLPIIPEGILIDGRDRIPSLSIPQLTIIKGDQKSASIAAASVIAKVTRDRWMTHYDQEFPEYQFGKHFGYGTKDHKIALRKLGPSPIHRRTFLRRSRETETQLQIAL